MSATQLDDYLAPLAVRMRPRSLDEIVGQRHLLVPGSPLRQLITRSVDTVGPASVILWGPPGTGKTTIASVISQATDRKFVQLSAITATIKDVRSVIDKALTDRDLFGRTTLLFLDEIHRFTKAQQDALLPAVENHWVVLIAATTENPSFSVVSPLLSRSLVLTLTQLTDADIDRVVRHALQSERGLNSRFLLDDDAREHLVRLAAGDARKALTSLEAAAAVASGSQESQENPEGDSGAGADQEGSEPAPPERATQDDPVLITLQHAELAVDKAVLRYDRAGDQHYDVASALIKSIRGSDVDAALHYLARMLEAGEDVRFIARRLMISASEDIGMADPTALQTAVAAATAVNLIGMPEGRIILSEAVVHLATAPKSNAAYQAIDRAIADVRSGKGQGIPAHLRDAHYPGAGQLGHGVGYVYSHHSEHAIAEQQYAPDDLVGVDYYQPSDRGHERALQQRLQAIRAIVRGQR